MKIYALLPIAICFFACKVEKKTMQEKAIVNSISIDTLNYIKENFIKNKEKYIGKELGTLLSDLKIPIKRFNAFGTIAKSINLEFNDGNAPKKLTMEITWKTSLTQKDIQEHYLKITHSQWQEEIRIYYSKLLIGDINIKE